MTKRQKLWEDLYSIKLTELTERAEVQSEGFLLQRTADCIKTFVKETDGYSCKIIQVFPTEDAAEKWEEGISYLGKHIEPEDREVRALLQGHYLGYTSFTYTYFKDSHKLRITHSTVRLGINKHNYVYKSSLDGNSISVTDKGIFNIILVSGKAKGVCRMGLRFNHKHMLSLKGLNLIINHYYNCPWILYDDSLSATLAYPSSKEYLKLGVNIRDFKNTKTVRDFAYNVLGVKLPSKFLHKLMEFNILVQTLEYFKVIPKADYKHICSRMYKFLEDLDEPEKSHNSGLFPSVASAHSYSLYKAIYPWSEERLEMEKTDFYSTTAGYIEDYLEMSIQCGEMINTKMGYKRLRREHDRLAKEAKFRSMPELKPSDKFPTELVVKDAEVTFIDTKEKLLKEADMMQHCVASYANHINSGRSGIYHIEYKGEPYTLELRERRLLPGDYVEYPQVALDGINISQLRGVKNCDPPKVLEANVLHAVKEIRSAVCTT